MWWYKTRVVSKYPFCYENQIQQSCFFDKHCWRGWGLNLGPFACRACALTTKPSVKERRRSKTCPLSWQGGVNWAQRKKLLAATAISRKWGGHIKSIFPKDHPKMGKGTAAILYMCICIPFRNLRQTSKCITYEDV